MPPERLRPEYLKAIKVSESAGVFRLVLEAQSLPLRRVEGDLSPDKRRSEANRLRALRWNMHRWHHV